MVRWKKERKEIRKNNLVGGLTAADSRGSFTNFFSQIITALDHCADETVIDVRVILEKNGGQWMSPSSLPAGR